MEVQHSGPEISQEESDTPLRRGAFKQASQRLQIIANCGRYLRHARNSHGVSDNELSCWRVDNEVAGVDVPEPAQKKLKLKKCQVLLMDVKQNVESKDQSCISNDGAEFGKDDSVLRVDEKDSSNPVKSDFDFVCTGIQKVVLESPPINSNESCSRSTDPCIVDTSCSDTLICDICKLDFLKLDELRNHIEQDHFAPTY